MYFVFFKKFAEFVVKHFMEKRKLNFLLKNQFLKRSDISKYLDKYQYLSWIKYFKNDKYVQVSSLSKNLLKKLTTKTMNQQKGSKNS